ncbi:Acetyl-coenzyme A carboxylase carboxyl transferase subunit alpha [compost metagenome]
MKIKESRRFTLDFEAPILELEEKIEEFKRLATESEGDLSQEITLLEERAFNIRRAIYENLTPIQRIQIARHPARPSALDYILAVTEDFTELHGDRMGFDDQAIVGGLARFNGRTVMVIAQQKGRDTKDNILRNFGMAHPEGYRKALRLMKHAAKFGFPIITLIDTMGAYPGIEAEERGQGGAIAQNLLEMSQFEVPIVSVVIGEGASGGALGIGVADRILMLEHAYYAVIGPEGCAAILWKDASKAPKAAQILKLTGEDLVGFGVVDAIIPEPVGGAHRDSVLAAANLKEALAAHLDELLKVPGFQLVENRYGKYRQIGRYAEEY